MRLVAPLMSVQLLVPFGLDCHWIVHVPVPPLVVAVSVTLPPSHTVLFDGLMLTVGPGSTTIVAVFEVDALQPPPVQL